MAGGGRLKRWLRSEQAIGLGAALAAAYIRLVHATSRWQTEIHPETRALVEAGRPVIGCFWHGRLMMMSYAWPFDRPFAMLISGHRDGRLIARTVERLGIRTVEGSTSRGAVGALRALARAVRHGESVGLTPDGPRGPARRAQIGAVAAAKLTGAAVVPAAFAVRRRRVLASWDHFHLALPFNRGVFLLGAPIAVAPDADDAALERARATVEAALDRVTAEADRRAGVAPADAAPTSVEASGRAGG